MTYRRDGHNGNRSSASRVAHVIERVGLALAGALCGLFVAALLARAGNDEIQLDLFLDYASNVALYPKFQEYFRTRRPPLLAVWGKNDPFFDGLKQPRITP